MGYQNFGNLKESSQPERLPADFRSLGRGALLCAYLSSLVLFIERGQFFAKLVKTLLRGKAPPGNAEEDAAADLNEDVIRRLFILKRDFHCGFLDGCVAYSDYIPVSIKTIIDQRFTGN
jgi:hypothetical protein